MKDWTGNNRTLGATLGASYLASGERPREDYYATHPDMVRDLLNAGAPLRKRVWEPACGAGHIVKVLREQGHEVYATDIVDRGCPDSCVQDFLWEFDGAPMGDVDIMTNPPYATALEFVERALACVQPGANVWMLLRLQFLEGKARRRLFDVAPPPTCGCFPSAGPVPRMVIFQSPKAAPLPTHGSTGSKDTINKQLSNGYESSTDAFLIMARKPTSLIPRTHRELCEIAERWLLGSARCRVAIAEPNCIITDEQPDAIGFRGCSSVLVEAKISRADFRADLKEPFRVHPQNGMGYCRYYICEPGIITVDDLPERWGLLHVLHGGRVRIVRYSRAFPEANYAAERSLLTACLYIQKPLKINTVQGRRIQLSPAFGAEAKETGGI